MSARKGTSYFYAIFGIAMVLFVLGIAGVIILEAKKISTEFKENLNVEIVLNEGIGLDSIAALQSTIKGKKYVKSIRFVSKEEAAKTLQKDLGEDFLDILGYNPLYNSFLINVYEGYSNEETFEKISAELSGMKGVKQVNFQKNILQSLNKVAAKATFIVLIIAVLLLSFAISLIFNTIRLAMFSRRFTIKTMQLFGATRWFIIRPFLTKSLQNGLFSGVIACTLLATFVFYFDHTIPELGLQGDLVTFALLFGALILFGILISFLSTLTAVLRYLRLKVEDLY